MGTRLILDAAILDNGFLIKKYAHLDEAESLIDAGEVETVIMVVDGAQTYEAEVES